MPFKTEEYKQFIIFIEVKNSLLKTGIAIQNKYMWYIEYGLYNKKLCLTILKRVLIFLTLWISAHIIMFSRSSKSKEFLLKTVVSVGI